MSLNNLADWKNNFPNRNHAQPKENQGGSEGGFLSGESAVIVSGPPRFSKTSGNAADLIPIGLVQQAQINQSKQLNQIYEIGGRIPFYIPARVNINASLSRVIFDGPSLFYALYRVNNSGDQADAGTVPTYNSFGNGSNSQAHDAPTMPYPNGSGETVPIDEGDTQADNNPGLFWTNLASSIFNKPLGLGFILYDMEGQPYGGVYLEDCYIQSHNFGISANATVLAENVRIAATKLRPLNAKHLITSG